MLSKSRVAKWTAAYRDSYSQNPDDAGAQLKEDDGGWLALSLAGYIGNSICWRLKHVLQKQIP